MKKNTLLKLAGALLVLTLITTTLVSGTYAKYVTTVTAEGTAAVAKWEATLNGKGTTSDTFTKTFDLFETFDDSGVDGDLLAPGTTGSFTLVYDTDASQVARNVTITLESTGTELASLEYLTFTSTVGTTTTSISPDAGLVTLLDQDYSPTEDGSGTITVSWVWPFESDLTQDTADTLDGITALTSIPLKVTFTATQMDVYPRVP